MRRSGRRGEKGEKGDGGGASGGTFGTVRKETARGTLDSCRRRVPAGSQEHKSLGVADTLRSPPPQALVA